MQSDKEDSQTVEIQTEVSSSLQSAVESDGSLVPRFCQEPAVCRALENLLLAETFSALYPTSCLLLALSQCPDAVKLFSADDGVPRLVERMILRLKTRSTARAVKEKLALSLCNLAQRARDGNALSLSRHAVTGLQETLADLLQNQNLASNLYKTTRAHLQAALSTLN